MRGESRKGGTYCTKSDMPTAKHRSLSTTKAAAATKLIIDRKKRERRGEGEGKEKNRRRDGKETEGKRVYQS